MFLVKCGSSRHRRSLSSLLHSEKPLSGQSNGDLVIVVCWLEEE